MPRRATWLRVLQMSRDEMNTRVRQEFAKRCDLLRYLAGMGPANLESPDGKGPGNFFFSPQDLASRVCLLRDRLSPEVESVVREADEICGHRFSLLGYSDVDYGPTIDWHLDAVSGKRAPLSPWFKIDFLDFEKVGDHKVIWELNRHQHLVTLAKAWCFTSDRRYIVELVAQLQSWQKANPYPLGINWASSLEVALRSLSWLWVLHLLAGCEELPPTFAADLLRGLMLSGRHIELYLSTYFSPNTHLLGEALALFVIGASRPELAAAERWKKTGWEILLKEMERQIRPDGLYFEQSLYYHVYALDFFLYARIIAARNRFAIPQMFDQTMNKMLDVIQALSQAGPPEAFGDDDGGRLFNPHRNRTENLTDPLAIGAVLYGRDDLASSAQLTEESVWLFGDQAVTALSAPGDPSSMQSRAFPAGGIYVMADSDLKAQLVLDAGPQGTGRCGHGHADALGATLSYHGHRWLVDSGSYRYVSGSSERDLFRGTGAHNSLRVDRLDQAVAEGPFAWSSVPATKAEQWITGNSFGYFVGSHDGYCRLPDPVVHRRFVFQVHGGFWMVRDVAEGNQRHDLEILWHFASGLDVRKQNDAIVAHPPLGERQSENAVMLALVPCRDSGWNVELATAPVSAAYGQKSSAPIARLSASVDLPAECAILLAPGRQDAAVGEFAAMQEAAVRGLRRYHYQMPNTTHDFFFNDAHESWDCYGWTSDARFLYCCQEDNRPVHVVMIDGSLARWQEKEVVKHRRQVERFEWLNRRGSFETSSSDSSMLVHVFEGELACLDSKTGAVQVK